MPDRSTFISVDRGHLDAWFTSHMCRLLYAGGMVTIASLLDAVLFHGERFIKQQVATAQQEAIQMGTMPGYKR